MLLPTESAGCPVKVRSSRALFAPFLIFGRRMNAAHCPAIVPHSRKRVLTTRIPRLFNLLGLCLMQAV